MPEGKISLAETNPPDTILVDLLAAVNKKFLRNPSYLVFSPMEHLAMILEETSKHKRGEIWKFVSSYIAAGPDDAADGMCIMFVLGYMYAKGTEAITR